MMTWLSRGAKNESHDPIPAAQKRVSLQQKKKKKNPRKGKKGKIGADFTFPTSTPLLPRRFLPSLKPPLFSHPSKSILQITEVVSSTGPPKFKNPNLSSTVFVPDLSFSGLRCRRRCVFFHFSPFRVYLRIN